MPDRDSFPRNRATHALAPLSAVGWYLDSQLPRSRQPEFPPEPDPMVELPAPDQPGWGSRLRNLGAYLFKPHSHAAARQASS